MRPLLPWLLLALLTPSPARADPPAPLYAPGSSEGPEVPIDGNDPARVHPSGAAVAFTLSAPAFPDDYPDPSLDWTWTLVWELSPDGTESAAWVEAGVTDLSFECGPGPRAVWHRYAWVFGAGGQVQALGPRRAPHPQEPGPARPA